MKVRWVGCTECDSGTAMPFDEFLCDFNLRVCEKDRRTCRAASILLLLLDDIGYKRSDGGVKKSTCAAAGLINGFLRAHSPALEVLPDALSWKPYWGRPTSEAPLSSLFGGTLLLHWLGPKPAHAKCMRCYLQNRSKGSAWGVGCGCSRVPFKSLFQLSFDKGELYWQALAAYEGYLERDTAEASGGR